MKAKTEIIKLKVREVAEAAGIDGPGELAAFLDISRSMADRLWVGSPFPQLSNLVAYADKFRVPPESLYERIGTTLPRRAKRSKENGRKVAA